jgi:outer membrane protein OmpA-like peptidoglycan-associated protein
MTALSAAPAGGGLKGLFNKKSKPSEVKDYLLKVNRSALAVVDSNVVVSLQMTAQQDVPATQSVVLVPVLEDTVMLRSRELPFIFINSRNQQIYFDREMKNDYPDALVLRKKHNEDLDINYLRTVPYEPWMQSAVLRLRKQSCACRGLHDRGAETLASFEPQKKPTTGAVQVQPILYPVFILPPADKSEKVREERGSAYLCFELNKWDIRPEYMTNPTELQKIHNSVNLVRQDSDVTIRRMAIEGYASPEGGEAHNQTLSQNRTQALKRYLEMSNIARGINIEANGRGENWTGFLRYLDTHRAVPQRERLLNIANSSISNDEKERRMRREAAEGFNFVLKNAFPALRVTNYTVVYTVRPFTLEESERVFETRPANLNLNEIYRLADKYVNDRDRYYAIMRKASMIYPDDPYINLSMACLAIKRGNASEAEAYLKKASPSPQRTLDEGIVYFMRGNITKARELVQEAANQGVDEAEKQLKEFNRLFPEKKTTNNNNK